MKIKKLFLLGVALVLLFSFTGCDSNLELGFTLGSESTYNPIVCAVKSKTNKLNSDNVTLNFYYGYIKGTSPIQQYDDWWDAEHVSFALYFYNADVASCYSFLLGKFVSDYRNIEGLWFVKEIPLEEFVSDDYAVSLSEYYKRSIFNNREYADAAFNHYETLTVPKEVLINKSGNFVFVITGISYDYQYKSYFLNDVRNAIYMKYKYINNETVKIAKTEPIPLDESF